MTGQYFELHSTVVYSVSVKDSSTWMNEKISWNSGSGKNQQKCGGNSESSTMNLILEICNNNNNNNGTNRLKLQESSSLIKKTNTF